MQGMWAAMATAMAVVMPMGPVPMRRPVRRSQRCCRLRLLARPAPRQLTVGHLRGRLGLLEAGGVRERELGVDLHPPRREDGRP